MNTTRDNHAHYFKDASNFAQVDVYRILSLFGVIHPCQQHLVKKTLCTGNRGHKDLLRDIQDIIDTAERWKEMVLEDRGGVPEAILEVARNG